MKQIAFIGGRAIVESVLVPRGRVAGERRRNEVGFSN